MPRWTVALLPAWGLACSEPTEPEQSPYELPPHGGCTVTQTVDETGGPGYAYSWTYDDEERYARFRYVRINDSYEQTWAYDGEGCLTDYTETTVADEDLDARAYRYVCADGFPASATLTLSDEEGETWSTSYTFTNIVEDGHVVLETIEEEDGDITRNAASWLNGQLVTYDSWYRESWESHEAWTRDEDGRVLTYVFEDPNAAWGGDRYTYVLDEHGRTVELHYGNGEDYYEVDSYVETQTWHDDIYSPLTLEQDYYADGIVDITYDWDCEQDWPWSCAVEVDSAFQSDDRTLDGEPEEIWDYTWTCP